MSTMSTTRKALTWLFWLFAGWCFLQSTLPTTGGDPVRTIMFASKWYLSHGIQWHFWLDSYQFYEMLVFHIMRFIPDPGSTLSTVFMVLAALVIWDMAERYYPNGHCAGPLAALLYVSMPVSRLCSFYALTEHTMVFLFLLGLNGVLRFSKSRRYRWLVAGGICAGAACGVDVNALIPALLLVLLAGRGWWVMLLSVIAGALPWYGMNILWYGNPIFPFHENWFGWMQWGTHEWIKSGQDICAVRSATGEVGSHFRFAFGFPVLMCAPLFIIAKFIQKPSQPKNDIRGCILIVFVALMLAYWLCVEHIIHARYWMPLLAVLALMGGVGVSRWKLTAKLTGLLLVVYMLAIPIPSVMTEMALTPEARLRFLMEQKPGWISIETVNQNAPDCRAYLLHLRDYRFYCDFEIGGHTYGPERYKYFMRADSQYDWLRERGYDYLILNYGFFERYGGDVVLSPDEFILRQPYTIVRIYELKVQGVE